MHVEDVFLAISAKKIALNTLNNKQDHQSRTHVYSMYVC